MLTTCAILAAATDGDLISGKVIATLLTAIFAAGGGIWIGKRNGEKDWTKRESELRAEIANELKTRIINDPLTVEQSGYQAAMKGNDKQHGEIFGRLRSLEQDVSAIKATMSAKFDGLSAQLMETREMVRSLYDKVCGNGGKRK